MPFSVSFFFLVLLCVLIPVDQDNMEALSLALFVECFIGDRLGSAVSGGFVMYSGQARQWHSGSSWIRRFHQAVRRVVLALLRQWSESKRLHALTPYLGGH